MYIKGVISFADPFVEHNNNVESKKVTVIKIKKEKKRIKSRTQRNAGWTRRPKIFPMILHSITAMNSILLQLIRV